MMLEFPLHDCFLFVSFLDICKFASLQIVNPFPAVDLRSYYSFLLETRHSVLTEEQLTSISDEPQQPGLLDCHVFSFLEL